MKNYNLYYPIWVRNECCWFYQN